MSRRYARAGRAVIVVGVLACALAELLLVERSLARRAIAAGAARAAGLARLGRDARVPRAGALPPALEGPSWVVLAGDSLLNFSPVRLRAADLRRLRVEDRPVVVGRGALRLVSAPLKDADDWDIVGAILVPVRPWESLPSYLRRIVPLAALPLILALASALRRAREPDRVSAVLGGLAMAWLVAGAVAISRPLGDAALPLAVVGLAGAAAVGAGLWLSSARRAPEQVRETLAAWGFLAPSLGHLLVFSIGPLLFTLWLSLHRWDLLDPVKPFIGGANYRELARDPLFWNALRNTLVYALYVPATMVLALGAALVLDQRLPGIGALRTLVFLPYVASYVAIAIVWQWIFNLDYGLLNALLRVVGLAPVDWLGNPATALPAVMLVSAWVWLGYQMVIFLAGLQAIPAVLYEAATLDGAGPWQRFRHITLPMLRPVSVYVFVTGVIWSFHSFTLVYVMTEGGPVHSTDVLVYHIYQSAFEFRRLGYASALSWVLFGLLLALTLAQWRLLTRRVEHV